jgi:hypothetical protein
MARESRLLWAVAVVGMVVRPKNSVQGLRGE